MKGEQGFTLIEMLVSIALLALVVAFLPGLLNLGTRALQSGAELDARSAATPARRFIEQRLETAMAVLQRRSDGRLQLGFEGRANSIKFVAPASLGENRSGLHEYELAFAPGSSGAAGEVTAGVRPFSIESAVPAERSTLLRNVTQTSFRYFGQRRADVQPAWHKEWLGEGELPSLVEMTSVFNDANQAAERPLIIDLKFAPRR